MDETLKRLLDAELRAETIARQAEEAGERTVQDALLEAKAEEKRFEARIPELYASYREKAEARAEQVNGESRRRYEERIARLRSASQAREARALDAAFALLLDAEADD